MSYSDFNVRGKLLQQKRTNLLGQMAPITDPKLPSSPFTGVTAPGTSPSTSLSPSASPVAASGTQFGGTTKVETLPYATEWGQTTNPLAPSPGTLPNNAQQQVELGKNQAYRANPGAWAAGDLNKLTAGITAGGGAASSAMPLQATSAPASYASGAIDPHINDLVQQFIQSKGLQANQSDPASLNAITQYLRTQGVNAQVDYTDQNGHTGGILVNGQPYQLINGSNQWTPLQPWEQVGGGGDAGGAGAPATGADPNDPVQGAMRAALLKMLNDGGSPTDISDPALAAQSSAFRVARDRSAGQERAALAERAAASGLNSGGAGSGAFDTGIQGIQEQAGQDEAANDANLVGTEIQAKRQQLTQALDLANALGARTEANALQLQLANLDNTYRLKALGQQQGQFEDTTAYNYANLKAELDRQAILAALGG